MDSLIAVLGVLGTAAGAAALCVLGGFVGYLVHTVQSFREKQQEAYKEFLPPIVEMVYDPKHADVSAYNRALLQLWLYGSEPVTAKLDGLYVIHKPERGDPVSALQKIIVAIRSDIQPWWRWKRLRPEDIHHLYTNVPRQPPGSREDGPLNR
jgi:hypothetical protein